MGKFGSVLPIPGFIPTKCPKKKTYGHTRLHPQFEISAIGSNQIKTAVAHQAWVELP